MRVDVLFFSCRQTSDHQMCLSGYTLFVIKRNAMPEHFRGQEAVMYGAILGDIIGSPFEFGVGDKTKEFDLFTKGCAFTDDSVMTIAVAEALIAVGPDASEMEIEAAAVTHNHPEGIKGAVATASCIFFARNGATKKEIKQYVEQEFQYDLSRTLDEIRPLYHHVESCQQTVPEAIISFLEAENFEDAVRNAVSLGGDADTLAAIAGSIAEAYFGIPAYLKAECRNRIDSEMLRVLDVFDEALVRNLLKKILKS